jgi:glycerol uptake facilitator-like aquaporin
MDKRVRMNLAELIGTLVVVLIGAGTVCATDLTGLPPMGVTAIALAEGLALAAVLTATLRVSLGCLNPAIVLLLWIFRRLDTSLAACLIGMQLLGAVLAGLVLRFTFSTEVLRTMRLGAPHLQGSLLEESGHIPVGALLSGTALEMFLTFVVTLALFVTVFDRRGPRWGGLIVGLAQTAAILFGYRLTGGGANPARWFGPAVWQITVPGAAAWPWLPEALIYAGGPILGALMGATVYTNVILPPEKWTESANEVADSG